MTISEHERLQRQRAVAWAEANIAASGVVADPADQAHNRRFIDGEIDLDEYVFLRKPFGHGTSNETALRKHLDRSNFIDDLMSVLGK